MRQIVKPYLQSSLSELIFIGGKVGTNMDEREIVLTIRDFKEILNQLLRQIDALEERVEILEQKNN